MNSKLIVAVENVVRRDADSGVLGDLFFMEDGVYFVAYDQFAYGSTVRETAGYLLGGVIGYGIAKSKDKEDVSSAMVRAAKVREGQYGRSMKERLDANPSSLTIPIGDIESLRFARNNTRLVCRLFSKEPLEFRFSTESSIFEIKRILIYLEPGPKPEADASKYGFDLPYPVPSELMEMLKNAQPIDAQTQQLIAENKTYMYNIYQQIVKKKKAARIGTCGFFKQYDTLRQALIETAQREKRAAPRSASGITVWVLTAFFLLLLYFIDADTLADWNEDSSIWLLLAGNLLFLSFSALLILFGVIRPMKIAKALIREL